MRVVDVSLAAPKDRPRRYYPYRETVPLAGDVFGADRCRVRVDDLSYASSTWDGAAEPDVTIQRAIATFRTRIEKEHSVVVGKRGQAKFGLADAPFVLRTKIDRVSTRAGVVNATSEVIRTADDTRVASFELTAGVSGIDVKRWLDSTSWTLAVGVLSWAHDHFHCR